MLSVVLSVRCLVRHPQTSGVGAKFACHCLGGDRGQVALSAWAPPGVCTRGWRQRVRRATEGRPRAWGSHRGSQGQPGPRRSCPEDGGSALEGAAGRMGGDFQPSSPRRASALYSLQALTFQCQCPSLKHA